MSVDPKLLQKAAKVYEANESVDGMSPKTVYESHKKCAPGEFNMHKEGYAQLQRAIKSAANPMATPERSYLADENRDIAEDEAFTRPGRNILSVAAPATLGAAGRLFAGPGGQVLGQTAGRGLYLANELENHFDNAGRRRDAMKRDAGPRPPVSPILNQPKAPAPVLPTAAPRPPVSMPPRGIGSAGVKR